MTSPREAVHREPVWRERSDFVIGVDVDSGATDVQTEQLWARRVDGSHFELCCIPFFTYHLALGDVVETDSAFHVQRVTAHSGRFVFRVWFGGATRPQKEILGELVSLGGLLERSSKNLVAVDASDEDHSQAIAKYLDACTDRGELVYETGKDQWL